MAMPDAVQNEKGRVVTLTWYKQGSTTSAEDLSGLTITGVIENIPGPNASNRVIAGALAVSDGPNGQFTWTYSQTDTATNGKYLVHFIATSGTTIIYKSIPALWEVVRAPTVSS